jgi:hypothetical protein
MKIYLRRNWYKFYDAIIPQWLNQVSYELDLTYEMDEKKIQKIYSWLFWVIVTN